MSSLDQSSGLTGFAVPNGKLVATVAANALTVALKNELGNDATPGDPLYAAFPSTTAALYVGKQITTALSAVLSSGSTAGATSAVPFRLWVLLFDNGDGTFTLALLNCSTATANYPLAEYGTASTVAEGGAGAADSAGVAYSTAAVSSKPFRIVGFLDWTSGLTTAGTWDTQPDKIQMFGPGIKKAGDIVQTARNPNSTYSSITSVQIPFDDTLPQSGEGTQVFSTDITPTSKINYLEHEVNLFCGNNAASIIVILALFQDAGANAIASAYSNSVIAPINSVMFARRQPGTTSATTYKVRMGDSAGGVTIYINGFTAARVFAGTLVSYHRINEIMG